ncbi:hypothetical protein [Actinoplanes sp. NPDC051411]|uniref:hypothetical protein n=1 Tax=Actinoplanes sp. NPDC051411 TaxID=3155522 RepID=UPI00341913A1
MSVEDWLLTGEERDNPHSVLSQRPWTTGNEVCPLIDGAAYFAELCIAVGRMRSGDVLMFTDWRGDPDERLDGPGSEVSRVFAQAASARALQAWHDGGRIGARPRGRLREYRLPKLSTWSRRTAPVSLRLLADPDGRPRHLRRTGGY